MRGIRLHIRDTCGEKFFGNLCILALHVVCAHPTIPSCVPPFSLLHSPQSALTCVEFTTQIQQSFPKVTVPFLCMIAEEDVVVDNSKAKELMKQSPSKDKTFKSYAALHGLLCEPAPLLGIIEDDFVQWLLERCKS